MPTKREPHGSASLHLASGISFLREEDTVFKAMTDGWRMQQRGGRNLKESTVKRSIVVVTRFQEFAGLWPWEWTAASMDEWMTDLVSVKGLAPATIRAYQHVIRKFCEYICSEHYGWAVECEQRFGTHPIQICHDWNTVAHLQDYEGDPGRRPLSRTEVQGLFDYADDRVAKALDSGRKGVLPAYRDATILKLIYAWGLRSNEATGVDITDFYRNAKAPEFGQFGVLQVRNGKSSSGGAPKRRSVLTVRGWAVEAVQDYLEDIWPLMRTETNALFLSERGTRLRPREVSERFSEYRDALGYDQILSPHALRHSYVTHLIEEGYDPVFVQHQVGHTYQSTTAIYTAVSGDFMNTMMREALGPIPGRNATEGRAK